MVPYKIFIKYLKKAQKLLKESDSCAIKKARDAFSNQTGRSEKYSRNNFVRPIFHSFRNWKRKRQCCISGLTSKARRISCSEMHIEEFRLCLADSGSSDPESSETPTDPHDL